MHYAKLKIMWMLLFVFVTTVTIAQKGRNKYDLSYLKNLSYMADTVFKYYDLTDRSYTAIKYQDCNKDSTDGDPLVGLSERRCLAIQLLKADSIMQSLYKKMLPTYGASFKRVQKIWLRYRWNQSGVIAKAYGKGAGLEVGYLQCLLEITNARINDLREF